MSATDQLQFNPPPGWPKPPPTWRPPAGWSPDPSWPPPPAGWRLWVPANGVAPTQPVVPDTVNKTAPTPPSGATDENRVAFLEAENAVLRARLIQAEGGDRVELNDAQVLQDVGIYRYHHPLETAAAYQDRLRDLESRIAELVKTGDAIVKSDLFTFNNSLAQGRKMSADLGKLMLRAYNAEADNALRTLKAGNVLTAAKRLQASRDAIARLGALMEMHISDAFHALRIEEIELTADWLMKKQEEREAGRDERARLREERRVERELAEERARLDKERTLLLNTLATLHDRGDHDPGLTDRLQAIDQAIAENDYRAANIRAGYVYVISNPGAFGPNVVKIGLTRRLEPRDRILELGGASVPFRFDTHTLFFSEDAVTLENELHHHFAHRALNQTNSRKEFFFATPEEVRDVLLQKVGSLLEYAAEAEATEYRQSLHAWPDTARPRS